MKNQNLLSNIKVATLTQLLILFLLTARTFVIPKYTTIETYGLFQTYLLYLPYLSFFAFGFSDGFYLYYAKYDLDDYKKVDFRSPFFTFVLITIIEAFVLIAILLTFNSLIQNSMLYIFVAINIPLLLISNYFTYFLQITKKINENNIISLAEKVLTTTIMLLIAFKGELTISNLILIDMAGRLVNILLSVLLVRKFFIRRIETTESLHFLKHCKIGIKLMIGSFLGVIIITIPRLLASRTLPIIKFSYFSFAYSILSIVFALISTISVTIFPHLAKNSIGKANLYSKFNDIFILFLPFILLSYYFLAVLINVLLPKYNESIIYLFPITIIIAVMSKYSAINTNFYKVLRLESKLFIDNLVMFLLSMIILFFVQSFAYAITLFTFLLTVRLYVSESYLRYKMNEITFNPLVVEFLYLIIFYICSNLNFNIGFTILLTTCIVHLLINRVKIKNVFMLLQGGKDEENNAI